MEIMADKSMIDSTASDFATFGAVHLDVTDGGQALRHWRDLIGLELLAETDSELRLGSGDRELLVLHPGATAPLQRAYSGLYHFALHLPSLGEFARVVARLADSGYHHYPTDHLTHFADYVDDPDGNGLEFVFETPERFGSVGIGPDGPECSTPKGSRAAGGIRSISIGSLPPPRPESAGRFAGRNGRRAYPPPRGRSGGIAGVLPGSDRLHHQYGRLQHGDVRHVGGRIVSASACLQQLGKRRPGPAARRRLRASPLHPEAS